MCVLTVSWVGSAGARCVMARGDRGPMASMAPHAAMAPVAMAPAATTHAAMVDGPMHAPSSHDASHHSMPADCAFAAHCTAVTAIVGTPPPVAMPGATIAPARDGVDGPLLGALDSAIAPIVPPPRG